MHENICELILIESSLDETAMNQFLIFFLQGTLLFFGHQDTLNDPKVFPEPEKFKPERWLNKEDIKIKMTNFGLGEF